MDDAIQAYSTALAEAADPTASTTPNTTTNGDNTLAKIEIPMIPPEPPLMADQVAELESKLDGGIIEEVINQGIAEMDLVKKMSVHKPWEPLIEEPVQGQWVYFERKAPAEKAVGPFLSPFSISVILTYTSYTM